MIIVLHGGNLTTQRLKLTQIKTGFSPLETSELAGDQLTNTNLSDNFRSFSLFSERRLIIIENPPASLKADQISDQENITVVLTFTKELTLNEQNKYSKQVKILFFPQEKDLTAFPFVDALLEKKPTAFLELEKLFNRFGFQYVVTFIYFGLRKLILPSKTASSYVQKKIAKQKEFLNFAKINQLYQATLETEYKIKSGLLDEKIGLTILVNSFLTN